MLDWVFEGVLGLIGEFVGEFIFESFLGLLAKVLVQKGCGTVRSRTRGILYGRSWRARARREILERRGAMKRMA